MENIWLWLCLFSYNNYEIIVFVTHFTVVESHSCCLSMACTLSFSLLSDTQIIGSTSKPHLNKLCGTCGGMLRCTVIRKRKCKTHETWKGCNYCLRAVVRLRKVHFVSAVKDVSFTELSVGSLVQLGNLFSNVFFSNQTSYCDIIYNLYDWFCIALLTFPKIA